MYLLFIVICKIKIIVDYIGIVSTVTQQKWLEDCNIKEDECVKWHEIYQLASKCTTSTRLVEFQFKLLHRRIATNEFLTKIGLQDNPNCFFCNEEPEKLNHLFWSCSKVTSFWNSLMQRLILSQIIPQNYKINISVALGLIPDSSKNHCQVNFCLLLARHYIWICKNKKSSPKVEGFLQYLKSIFRLEVKAGGALQKKWELLKSLI